MLIPNMDTIFDNSEIVENFEKNKRVVFTQELKQNRLGLVSNDNTK